jgi:uncharacterized protein
MKQPFVINSRKFDGRIHRSWKAELVEETADYWIFLGEFEHEVSHPNLGVIRRGTVSYEYYWKHKWFNIFRFHEPQGDLRNFYCNINQPPVLSGGVLDYVDLDIDVLLWKDFSFEILDLDEFEHNRNLFRYSDEMVFKCRESLDELLSMIKERKFPFT